MFIITPPTKKKKNYEYTVTEEDIYTHIVGAAGVHIVSFTQRAVRVRLGIRVGHLGRGDGRALVLLVAAGEQHLELVQPGTFFGRFVGGRGRRAVAHADRIAGHDGGPDVRGARPVGTVTAVAVVAVAGQAGRWAAREPVLGNDLALEVPITAAQRLVFLVHRGVRVGRGGG